MYFFTTGEMESADDFYGVSRQFFQFEINKKAISRQKQPEKYKAAPSPCYVIYSQTIPTILLVATIFHSVLPSR
jgi:hypothetical protein